MTRQIVLDNEIDTLNQLIKEMKDTFKTLPTYNSCINTPPPEKVTSFYSDKSISTFEDDSVLEKWLTQMHGYNLKLLRAAVMQAS